MNALAPGRAEALRRLIENRVGPGFWLGFQGYMAEPSSHPKEWRFGGTLGFGGKVHYNGRRLYVSAYPEDLSRDPHMQETIDALNADIAGLIEAAA